MNNDNTFVKLVPNIFVKDILMDAKKSKHLIEIDDTSFMVRDNESQNVVFKGIKIRNNTWGLTFSKFYYPDSTLIGDVVSIS